MRTLLLLSGLLLLAVPAAAHTGLSVSGGLSGVLHPLSGLDHLVAMVAVGLWGAQLGRPGVWMLPACFLASMMLGGMLGMFGASFAGTELIIAASAVVLGAAVTAGLRIPVAAAALIIAPFAFFHGYAHGQELPGAANAWAYSVGFLVATALLHGVGVATGLALRRMHQLPALRVLGAGIAGLGCVFLINLYA